MSLGGSPESIVVDPNANKICVTVWTPSSWTVRIIDRTSLLGPMARIADRLIAYAESGVTTLTIAPYGTTHDERIEVLRTVATALDKAGVS